MHPKSRKPPTGALNYLKGKNITRVEEGTGSGRATRVEEGTGSGGATREDEGSVTERQDFQMCVPSLISRFRHGLTIYRVMMCSM